MSALTLMQLIRIMFAPPPLKSKLFLCTPLEKVLPAPMFLFKDYNRYSSDNVVKIKRYLILFMRKFVSLENFQVM